MTSVRKTISFNLQNEVWAKLAVKSSLEVRFEPRLYDRSVVFVHYLSILNQLEEFSDE